ncbi:MAG: sprT domain-containing protein [Flavobacteriales bacterium]
MDKRTKYVQTFSKYVPLEFASLPAELLLKSDVQFKIVRGRKTKWGDFRPIGRQGKPQITVNGDLNPYAFLITTLHEFAHYFAFQHFGRSIVPHGKEWQREYALLLNRLLATQSLPTALQDALKRSLTSIKASSCSDVTLSRVLLSFDSPASDSCYLERLPKNTKFVLNDRIFVKGDKRRTRIQCLDIVSNKHYLIHLLAKVKPINE